jgi:hypothetical protein
MNKGIFYMLTATEVQHIKNTFQDLLAIADPSEYTEQDVHHAIELLDKIRPLDTEEVLMGLTELEEEMELDYE